MGRPLILMFHFPADEHLFLRVTWNSKLSILKNAVCPPAAVPNPHAISHAIFGADADADIWEEKSQRHWRRVSVDIFGSEPSNDIIKHFETTSVNRNWNSKLQL